MHKLSFAVSVGDKVDWVTLRLFMRWNKKIGRYSERSILVLEEMLYSTMGITSLLTNKIYTTISNIN